MAEGIDYSFGSGLTAAQITGAGKHFVCRYLSTQPNPKNINKAEFDNLVHAGLTVVLVWETTANRILSGHAGGVADAREADKQARALGAAGIPVYFACDFDSTEGQQAAINAYLDGAASVIGHARVGLYGGYWPVSRAFSAHKITFGWQTYAWSGGNWDKRAQIQQYRNAVKLGPAEVDLNRSTASDIGGWPRPHAPAPAHTDAAHAGWKEWDTKGASSLADVAEATGMAPASILRRTVEHFGPFDDVTSGWLNDVLTGKKPASTHIPAGAKLWVRG